MSTMSPKHERSFEMAYVLFLDIVAYSLQPLERQTELIESLQQIVRGTEVFRRARPPEGMISLPTGDGMALVFFHDPILPVQCALEIDAAVRANPSLKVRMGIHTGPVRRHSDIKDNMNVVGGGINMGQRVMDCGDAGHILVSRSIAEVLEQLKGWSDYLNDLGTFEVKHGVRIQIYNLYKDGVGNSALPLKLKAQRSSERGIVAPREGMPSIAVLAFTDMSAAKDQDWFCDGIAEEILNALTPLQGLRVAARTSAFYFKGKSADLRTIGEKLNVTTVLEGSVRRAGDRVRITAQLSDVKNGYQLWSERYDRELKDIFDVQDEIAKTIASRLRVTLGGLKADRLVEQATPNIDAYQLYLKGSALLGRRGASVPAGLQLLQKAAELDPGYSLAWAGVADAFTVLAYSGAMRGSEVKREAMTAAERSIELDPTSAHGHNALACASLLFENNHTIARKEFDRALELNPSYVLARCWYSLLYFQWTRGEYEQGIAEARRALDIDPLSAYAAMNLAGCLCTAGHLDAAIETSRLSVQLDPESFVARWMLGVSLGMAGGFKEAVSTLEAAAGMSGRHILALTCLAGVFGQWGKLSEAGALHRELLDRAVRGYIPAAHLAISAEASGQREEAIAFARRAWDEREPPFILWARHFPQYGTLRSDPRFAAILREMDAPEENDGGRP